jgi:hypothetical protein
LDANRRHELGRESDYGWSKPNELERRFDGEEEHIVAILWE